MPEWVHHIGVMLYPFAICAVLALMICFERAVFFSLRYARRNTQYRELEVYLQQHRHYPKHRRDEMAAIMLGELQNSYDAGLKTLRIIGSLSPLLGLLGTIFGIIEAFKLIAQHTGAVSPSLIADGLWQAMLTTAIGLIIALPCLLFAHVFKSLGERQLNQFCLGLNKLSLSFEDQAQGTDKATHMVGA